jgi:hypothetical protein
MLLEARFASGLPTWRWVELHFQKNKVVLQHSSMLCFFKSVAFRTRNQSHASKALSEGVAFSLIFAIDFCSREILDSTSAPLTQEE